MVKILLQLVKKSILLHALMAVGIGYMMSLPTLADFKWDVFGVALMGLGFVFSGSASLNHLQEMHYDMQMDRTSKRPLPSGNVSINFEI